MMQLRYGGVTIRLATPGRIRLWLVGLGGLVVLGLGVGLAPTLGLPIPGSPAAGQAPALLTASLTITSRPPGATVRIDGRDHGVTPLTAALASGRHDVHLHLAGTLDEMLTVPLADGGAATIDLPLWATAPRLSQLRPPGIGLAILDARPRADGRVTLTTAPHGRRDQRELWLVEADSPPQRIGPPTPAAVLATDPGGSAVAYLQPAPSAAPRPSLISFADGTPLEEVWLSHQPGDSGTRLLAVADVPPLAGYELTDLIWAPDGQHLLVVGESPTRSGGVQTQFLWLPLAGGAAITLAHMEGQVVPGSGAWSPAGDRLAFLAEVRAASTVVLALLSPMAPTPATRLRNLADAAWPGGTPLPTTPLAWTPDGQHLVFPLPDGGSTARLGVTDLSTRPPVSLPALTGQAPVWRDATTLLLLQGSRDGGLTVLRAAPDLASLLAGTTTVPATGTPAPSPTAMPTPQPLAHLAIPVGPGAVGAVWQPNHRQALIVTPHRTSQELVWWWVRWTPN